MKLFEPIKIGNKEIKNRIVMSPMTNHFADNGFVTERMIEFYKTRAKGGRDSLRWRMESLIIP